MQERLSSYPDYRLDNNRKQTVPDPGPVSRVLTSTQTSCSPRLSHILQKLKESLSLLELEFTEFRENTRTSATKQGPAELLREELHQLRQEHTAALKHLQDEVSTLKEENQQLHKELARIREETQHTDTSHDRDLNRGATGKQQAPVPPTASQDSASTTCNTPPSPRKAMPTPSPRQVTRTPSSRQAIPTTYRTPLSPKRPRHAHPLPQKGHDHSHPHP
ncbi:hypothetical protein SKAU_G00168300 [Synaphobranchus kaupii]|uniref:Uncharacterized protein n=1 Tax=Synaphobranchus kaupii TaxID=118154 RepID=A0A9Q1FKH7_SYNKA|nr:hypothetical protein SKAU_G00168300 [Synaphobranchus kaupii]